MDIALENILDRHPMLACLDRATWGAICADEDAVMLSPGQLLYEQGTTADRMYVITKGMVTLINANDSGDNIGPLSIGELVGSETLIFGAFYTHTAQAISPLIAHPIPADRLIAHLEGKFESVLAMIGAVSASLRQQIKAIADFKMQSTAERLAGYLVSLTEAKDGPVIVHLTCRKRDLAEQLGMDPATLSRTIAKLRPYGVKTSPHDRMSIADIGLLRKFVATDGQALEDND